MIKDCVAEMQLTLKPKRAKHPRVETSSEIYDLLKTIYDEDTINHREFVKAIFLNSNLRVLGWLQVAEGGINNCMVDNRVVMQAALLCNATFFVLSHNHPSGSLRPSREDDMLTQSLKKCGTVMHIQMLDHIIVSEDGYYSYNDEGRL